MNLLDSCCDMGQFASEMIFDNKSLSSPTFTQISQLTRFLLKINNSYILISGFIAG
jgi:hypothetical protein